MLALEVARLRGGQWCSSAVRIGNVHVGRWGEGSEHCHIWFMARPARMEQFRSSFAAIWDDVLPPVPEDVWRASLEVVRRELNSG